MDQRELEQNLGPVEIDRFCQALNHHMNRGSLNRGSPGYDFFLGWTANNEARIPRDSGDLADSRVLDLVNELMGILHTGHLNADLERKLEEKLTPLLSIAYAEMDKANGKDPSWELIPRRQHRIYYTYDFMRGRC